jgi:hypothetical protein
MLPSVKTLRTVFGDNAKRARAILEMTRAELEAAPEAEACPIECYNFSATEYARMHVLDRLAGTHGVESFETRRNGWCDYLNAGDAYAATLVRYRGRYRVTSWGDIAERGC